MSDNATQHKMFDECARYSLHGATAPHHKTSIALQVNPNSSLTISCSFLTIRSDDDGIESILRILRVTSRDNARSYHNASLLLTYQRQQDAELMMFYQYTTNEYIRKSSWVHSTFARERWKINKLKKKTWPYCRRASWYIFASRETLCIRARLVWWLVLCVDAVCLFYTRAGKTISMFVCSYGFII